MEVNFRKPHVKRRNHKAGWGHPYGGKIVG
jgi:hypothetical protein